jgi:uncharacterized protein (DUF1684 family)
MMRGWIILLFFLFQYGWQLNAQDANYVQKIKDQRVAYSKAFLQLPHSPLPSKKLVKGLRFYAPDPQYRLLADVVLTPDSLAISLATSSGKTQAFVQYAWAIFSVQGMEQRLALYRNATVRAFQPKSTLLFLPFKDATNGETTYGGGKYLEIPLAAIQNQRLELDFNLAHNPWCAYDTGFDCPLPPRKNWLEVKIEAGEKLFGGGK